MGVALRDHLFRYSRVFLEMVSLPVRVQRSRSHTSKMKTWFGSFCDSVILNSRQPGSCFTAAEPFSSSCGARRSGCRWSVWGSARSKKTGEPIPACQKELALIQPAPNSSIIGWVKRLNL